MDRFVEADLSQNEHVWETCVDAITKVEQVGTAPAMLCCTLPRTCSALGSIQCQVVAVISLQCTS